MFTSRECRHGSQTRARRARLPPRGRVIAAAATDARAVAIAARWRRVEGRV